MARFNPIFLSAMLPACGGSAPEAQPPPAAEITPRPVVLHRLNRTEYDRTVHDLLGTDLRLAEGFPEDDRTAGFDNIATNLTVSELHVAAWLEAAEQLADEALGLTGATVQRVEAEAPQVSFDEGFLDSTGLRMQPRGSAELSLEVETGTYLVAVRAAAYAAPQDVVLEVAGEVVEGTVRAADAEAPEVLTWEVQFDEEVVDLRLSRVREADGDLALDWFEVVGPVAPVADALVGCDVGAEGASACGRRTLEALAERAWRRPLADLQRSRLHALVEELVAEEPYRQALAYGVMAVLTSPSFLYRVEPVPEPGSAEPQPLDDWAVASRLSYFLWSSMPDQALFDAASAGELQTPEGVARQALRMLADERASALVEHFGGQWLYMRGIDSAVKAPERFPHLDEALRASMREEMRRFFASFVHSERDLRELLTAPGSPVDASLAAHYGVPGALPRGRAWAEVDLASLDRGGLLGQAGWLTVVSHPARTSPVLRGKFVLEQLLCAEPPAPPPGVDALELRSGDSQREQLEAHRADDRCRGCHEVMDELGFALEHFDPVGAYRESDEWGLVDASARLPDGPSFYGARELGAWVAADPRFPRCVAEQLLTYALGRVPTSADAAALEEISRKFAADGTFASLVVAIVESPGFRHTAGVEGAP